MLLFQVFNLENMLFQNKSEIYYASYEAIIQIKNSIYFETKTTLTLFDVIKNQFFLLFYIF